MSKQLNNFSKRLKQLMLQTGHRQVDLITSSKKYESLYGCSLSKQDVSNYLSGKTTPLSNKLNLICKTLGVDTTYFTNDFSYENYNKLTNEEESLVNCWRACTPRDQELVAYILKDYGFILQKVAENAV